MTDQSPVVLAVVPARWLAWRAPEEHPVARWPPLLAYTIAAGRASAPTSPDLLVSTEDPEIADVARDYGADVIERPVELATDEAPTAPVIQPRWRSPSSARGGPTTTC